MDNRRLFLYGSLFFVLFLIWQQWQVFKQPPQARTEVVAPATDGSNQSRPEDLPRADSQATPASVPKLQQTGLNSGGRIQVETDVYRIEIDTLGGDLRRVELLDYPVSVDRPDQPFVLMEDGRRVFIAQSGLLSAQARLPSHHEKYSAGQARYTLEPGRDKLEVRLHWQGDDGIRVDKVYTFHRGRYVIDVRHELVNGTGQAIGVRQYRQLQRSAPTDAEGQRFIYTYTGGVIYSPQEKYEKIKFEKMAGEPLDRSFANGWAAMIQHYFVGAWIPDPDETNRYYSKVVDSRYLLGLMGPEPEQRVEPGQRTELHSRLYVGPKLQDEMAGVAKGLELTVDYGLLTVIAEPIFWLMKWIHGILGNWGWTIIVLTILIKLAFFRLSAASYRSMANMRKLQPRMATLKERYGDDRNRFNQEMMKLYKTEKINPLGGCLPILVQIPVFIALYWVLLESVELRQASFIFWLQDLSTRDPYFVLPLLMGVSMFVQQKLNPAPVDPIQAKVMQALPIVFTVFFAFFPSGLVLYWVVNNILSIAQQWKITRDIEQARH